jgi:PEP-CTERM motif
VTSFLVAASFFGADFTVSQVTTISSIGARFADTARQSHNGANGDGSIFGAIVQVDPVTGLPANPVETLMSIVLGSAVFTPTTDGDNSTPLSVTLQPGTYGLVFGSGLLGATGVADLLAGNDPVGSPSIFVNDFAPFASDPNETDIRLFATAVPEPGSLMLLLSAGIMFAGAARRRGSRRE